MVTSRQKIKAKIPVNLYLVLVVLLPNAHLCNILFLIMSTTSQYKTLKQIQFKIQMYVNGIYQITLYTHQKLWPQMNISTPEYLCQQRPIKNGLTVSFSFFFFFTTDSKMHYWFVSQQEEDKSILPMSSKR